MLCSVSDYKYDTVMHFIATATLHFMYENECCILWVDYSTPFRRSVQTPHRPHRPTV